MSYISFVFKYHGAMSYKCLTHTFDHLIIEKSIFVSGTDVQTRPSGDTPSPSPKAMWSNNTSTPCTRKEIKDSSPNIKVSLDEVIEMPQLELANLTLELAIFLQETLAKKKKQEELRREYQ